MLRTFLLFAGVAIITTNTHAAYTTPGSGVIWNPDSLVAYSSGTLTGNYPDYALNDVVTIAAGDRLIIPPGTSITVAMGTGIGITVLGGIRAAGTATDSIVLKGLSSAAGSHRGFRLEDSAIDSACVFSYCRIQDAVEGIHCLNADPVIDHCFFTNNSSNGVRLFGASPVIRDCIFIENRQSAITANLGSSPLIEGNLFTRNNAQNTSARNQIAVGPQGVNNPIIRNNELSNESYFRAGAISLVNIESGGACGAVVEGNFMHDNSYGVLSQGVNMTPMIRYNRIENNRINPDPLVSGSGISVQVGGPTNAPVITGNHIAGNYWGITLVSSAGFANSPQPDIGNLNNADTSDDGWNVFVNNNNGGTVYQLFNNGNANIFAQNNYWGSTDSTLVESWITHQADSSVYGFVLYEPIGRPGMGPASYLRARQVSDSLVMVSWRFTTTGEGGLLFLAGADSSTLGLVATLASSDTSYTVTAPYGMLRYYGISSFNRFGNGDTAMTSFTIVDITPPPPPTGVSMTVGTVIHPSPPYQFSAFLTWQSALVPDLADIAVYRSAMDSLHFTLRGIVSAADTAFADTIGCDSTYWYRVVERDTAGNEGAPASLQFGFPCPLGIGGPPDIPHELGLDQNFPNPFNPETSLRYALPSGMHVTLEIMNTLGQVVDVPYDAWQAAGTYTVPWNAAAFPSGIYFCRLRAGGTTFVRKLALIR